MLSAGPAASDLPPHFNLLTALNPHPALDEICSCFAGRTGKAVYTPPNCSHWLRLSCVSYHAVGR